MPSTRASDSIVIGPGGAGLFGDLEEFGAVVACEIEETDKTVPMARTAENLRLTVFLLEESFGSDEVPPAHIFLVLGFKLCP